MSLRWRFALILAASTIAVSAVAGAGALFSTGRALDAEADAFLRERMRELPPRAVDLLVGAGSAAQPEVIRFPRIRNRDGEFGPFERRDGRAALISPDLIVQGVDGAGDVTLRVEGSPAFEVPEDLVDGDGPTFSDIRVDDRSYRLAVLPARNGGALVFARDVTENAAVLAALQTRILSFGVVLAAVAAVAGWFIAVRTVRPVEELSAAADRVAKTRELEVPIEVDREDEVGRLARSFNTMLAALRESKDQQHRLVMDASHELRTPLTSLRTNIEVLLRSEELASEDYKHLLDDVDAELKELGSLVGELVDLATDRNTDEAAVPLDLADVAATTVERSRRRTGREISVQSEPAPLTGRRGQLDRAIWNLLENADKWSPDGAPIEVTVRRDRLEVRDHGPGFTPEDLPRVFERFYRATSARNLPGSGLGLAIVAQIVEGHGGEPFAANHPDGGAVVGFWWRPHFSEPAGNR